MRNNRGVAIAEFAIVLPLLIILLFGIIEFGFIIYDKAIITNASREGAREGIVFRTDAGGYISPNRADIQLRIEQRITNYLRNYLISLGSASVMPSLANGGITATAVENSEGEFSPGGELTVNVVYNYGFLILSSFGSLTPQLQLSATTIMRLE